MHGPHASLSSASSRSTTRAQSRELAFVVERSGSDALLAVVAGGSTGDLELVLADRTRVPLVGDMTIGRAPGSTLQLDDPAVSRRQARISRDGDGRVVLEDAGSSYGTWLDGHRVNGRGRCGTARGSGSATRSCSSSAGATRPRRGGPSSCNRGSRWWSPRRLRRAHPKVRSGYALKRLEASEGAAVGAAGPGVGSLPAACPTPTPSSSSCSTAGARWPSSSARPSSGGAAGPPRLARLLVGARRARACSAASTRPKRPPCSGRTCCNGSRHRERRRGTGAGELFERLYRRGGWRLFTPPRWRDSRRWRWRGSSRFPYLVVGPLRDAVRRRAEDRRRRRWSSCSAASRSLPFTRPPTGSRWRRYGRRVRKAGLKLLLIFPYAYRRHIRGMVRAQAPPDRDQRGGAGLRPVARGALRALLPGAARREPARHPLPARVCRVPRGVLQPESVRRSGRLPDPGRPAARAGPAAAGARTAAPATRRRARGLRLSGARALRPLRGRLVGAWRPASRSGCRCATSRRLAQVAPAPVVWAVMAASGWPSSCRCSCCWAGRCAAEARQRGLT